MISENLKSSFFAPSNWLRISLALIFFSAGLFRVLNPAAATAELAALNLPGFLTWIILAIELGGGIFLFLGKRTRLVSWLFIVFLVIALISALAVNGQEIVVNAHKLFVFDPEPTDFFMHAVFLLILLTLVFRQNKNK